MDKLVPNSFLLVRKNTEKKIGYCSKFCWYRSFEPVVVDVAYYCKNSIFS